eukprot:TRINITY_DN15072_c0_g1_i1.p1 TRINITY_DN15072_c0_g1~~TRINITY_DN15072_c0_g1_i1.p1  ORF type:complete len:241 (+),score=74.43 TRINITY_DN15072_c0_g1_i1:37-759(+)
MQALDNFAEKANKAKAYIAEFIGTFFLVMAVSMDGGFVGVGVTLMVMVFTFGHISGAHYNPAVTLAVLLSGRNSIKPVDAIIYIVVQIAASVLAAAVALGLIYNDPLVTNIGYPTLGESHTGYVWQGMFAEFIFTFALASVVLNVTTSKDYEGNSFFGLAIGFTIIASGFAIGGITGACLNPAVGTGPGIIAAIKAGSVDPIKWIWLYYIFPLLGGFLASIMFRIMNYDTDYRSNDITYN